MTDAEAVRAFVEARRRSACGRGCSAMSNWITFFSIIEEELDMETSVSIEAETYPRVLLEMWRDHADSTADGAAAYFLMEDAHRFFGHLTRQPLYDVTSGMPAWGDEW